MTPCILCDPNRDSNPTIITPFEYWTTLVNFKQPTLGSSLIVLNRHIESLDDLSRNEKSEYWGVVKVLENAIRQAFKPDRINNMMLANLEPHIHYHVVPRYSSSRHFANKDWIDSTFPKLPILATAEQDQKTLSVVISQLRQYL